MKPSLSMGRLITVVGVIACVTLGIGHGFATAQSPVGGNFAISTAPSHQNRPAIAFDGTNYLVVWDDARSGPTGDIYAARVSAVGIMLDGSGFPIATPTGWQQNAAVAFGNSSYLIVWEDYRAGTPQIYGARVTPAGQVLDRDGFIIASSATAQFNPAVAFDGVNFLVVWSDTLGSGAVRGARVTAAGIVLDPAGFSVFTAPFASRLGFPTIAFDGVNYLVVFIFGLDVIGTPVTPGGAVLAPGPFAISQAPSGQPMPSVAFDGTNYLVVWCCNPQPDLSQRISAARVSRTGTVLDAPSLTLSSPPALPGNVRVAFAGASYLLVWDDGRASSSGNVFASYVSPSGVTTTPQGVQISSLPIGVPSPFAYLPTVGASANGFLVAWSDLRNDPGLSSITNPDIFGQIVGSAPSSANDTFDGNAIDPTKWSPYITPTGIGTVTERNGRLEVTLNPGAANVGVTGKCFVAGDFDVQVDFLLLNWPASNNQTVSLGLADLGSGTFGLYNAQRFSGATESYMMVLPESVAGSAPASGTGGKLRWVRAGSTLTGYYDNGAGFVALASATVPTVPTRVVLNVGSFSPSGGAVSVAYDNFRVNGGSVTCAVPAPSISVRPSALDFGIVPVGAALTGLLTVENVGGGSLNGSCTVQGPFELPDGCSFVLGPTDSRTIRVQFNASKQGVRTAEIIFSSNGGTAVTEVRGQGTTLPHIMRLTPSSGSSGAMVSIEGFNFGGKVGQVTFGQNRANKIETWGDNRIDVVVPQLTAGVYDVTAASANGTSNPVPFTVFLSPPSVRLAVVKKGRGSGRVVSDPVGIACGSQCEADFSGGTHVRLTATADSGSIFVGWNVPACIKGDKCSIVLTEGRVVEAFFAPKAIAGEARVIIIAVCGAAAWGDECRQTTGWYDPRDIPDFKTGVYNFLNDEDLRRFALDPTASGGSGFDAIGLRVGALFPNAVILITSISVGTRLADIVRAASETVTDVVAGVYQPGDKVYLVGHSFGGGVIQNVAWALKKRKIPLMMTGQADSIGLDAEIPKNVTRAFNFYTSTGACVLRAVVESNIFAEDPKSTTASNERIDSPQGPDTGFFSVCQAHANMDNDSRVWFPMMQYVLESLGVK